MKSVHSSERIKEIESYTINTVGIDEAVLMERAAVRIANAVMDRFTDKNKRFLFVCGAGNNGADGLCCARILHEYGYDNVEIYCKPGKTGLHDKQKRILSYYAKDNDFINDISIIRDVYDVVVDALFGIGINRNLSDEDVRLINIINSMCAYRYSVDVPSGLNSTDGSIYNACICADETICLGAYKKGLFVGEGPNYSGKVKLCNIGFFANEETDDYLALEEDDIKNLSVVKKVTANKGNYGKTLVIAGSADIYGAAFLAAKTALTSGCGMVKVITHENNRYSFEHDLPEAMYSFYETDANMDFVDKDLEWCNTVIIGPGLSLDISSKILVKKLINSANLHEKTVIIDADAINVLATDKNIFLTLVGFIKEKSINCVITPHKKELSRLKEMLEVKSNDEDFCRLLYSDYSIVTIAKDANTRIFGIRDYINFTGNEGMATAGSGDVLSGLLGGLLYRLKDEDFTKACAACVWIHGKSGDEFVKDNNSFSLIAGRLIDYIGKILDFLT